MKSTYILETIGTLWLPTVGTLSPKWTNHRLSVDLFQFCLLLWCVKEFLFPLFVRTLILSVSSELGHNLWSLLVGYWGWEEVLDGKNYKYIKKIPLKERADVNQCNDNVHFLNGNMKTQFAKENEQHIQNPWLHKKKTNISEMISLFEYTPFPLPRIFHRMPPDG